jgi:hypothetical protein
MRKELPKPISANIVYDSIEIENPVYDPITSRYVARVYGVCGNRVLPLIIRTAAAVRTIEEVVLTDDEIDEEKSKKPGEKKDRVTAGIDRALDRLYTLIDEKPKGKEPANA